MPRYNKHAYLLERIVYYCDEIERTVNRFGYSFEVFVSDPVYQNACAMCILQIGELASRFNDSFRTKHTAIPWRAIKGMRNILAHEYEKVNYEEFWNTIVIDIPILKACCKRITPLIDDPTDIF